MQLTFHDIVGRDETLSNENMLEALSGFNGPFHLGSQFIITQFSASPREEQTFSRKKRFSYTALENALFS